MSRPAQSAASHASMVTGYHYVATALLMLPTVWFLWRAVSAFSIDALALALFAVGVNVVGFYARAFPLGVQDRVIRLEERIRLARLLPAELQPRIEEIDTEHLIGLRFASDEELADLTRRILDGELADRKAVKAAIRSWRADHQRI